MTIRTTVLPCGLTVLTDGMPAVESASVGVWVRAGTRDERPEQNGIAHFLEHMAFKGTARRSPRAIAEEIEAVGGHLNAFTSREQTAYYARVLAEDVPLAVDLLADILQHSTLDEGELEREREVVVQEIGQAFDTPDDVVFDHFQAVAYPDQAMGRPVLGTAEIVRGLDRDSVGAYLGRHYRGTRMILAAAGRVEHDAVVDLAARAFEALTPGGPGEVEPARYAGGESREPRNLEQVHLVLGFPGFAFDDEDYYALSVFSTLFGGGMSSRLFQEVREERGLAYSIYSFHSSYRDGGLFGIYAGTGPGEVEELVGVVAGEAGGLAQTLSEAEIARARAQIKAGVLMALESSWSRCERLANHLISYDRIVPVEEIVARIEAVDAGAIVRTTRRLFEGRPTIAAVGPVDGLESYDRIARRFG